MSTRHATRSAPPPPPPPHRTKAATQATTRVRNNAAAATSNLAGGMADRTRNVVSSVSSKLPLPQPVQHAIQTWPLIVAGIIAGCVLLLLLICLCWAARGRVKRVAQSKRDAYRQRRADSVPIVADAPRAQPPRKGSKGKRRGSRVAVDDEDEDDDDTELI